ncbi:MAG: 2,3-butanediol dehydrogenase [Chloroflexi bacterium]|nr:2,3-butanediol dehydrogenase [Chloroflexota bacterium]MBI4504210.1 2,3-butanediol dehydrogenase [Chloroflexota bacterium]
MLAARWHGRRDVRVEEVAPPGAPGAGEAQVRVRWCGICGSDLHEYVAGPILISPAGRPHPLTGREPPLTLGHELVGTVVAVGPGVEAVRPGDRVTADACLRCGTCPWCQRGQYNLCKRLGSVGLAADGGFAALLNLPAYTLYALPDGIADEAAALCEPFAVALHAVKRGGVQPGHVVAVVGAGPIGLCVLQAARAAGAAAAYAVEPLAARRERALALGATAAFDAGTARGEVYARTGGLGADVAIECVGHPESLPLALELAGRGGTAVVAGIFEQPSALHANRLVLHEKRLVGSIAYAGEFPAVMALLADGRLRAEPLVTDRIALREIVAAGFEALLAERERHVKVLVAPE